MVVTHGHLGHGIGETGQKYGASVARRGAFFEKQVARGLQTWLSRRPDSLHVFHDVCRLDDVQGAGYAALHLGETNIDHVVLSGSGWIMLDAKGCGDGTLSINETGQGIVLRPNGTTQPQPWMDDARAYARAGALFRLTEGKRGAMAWVVPDNTEIDPRISDAVFAQRGGYVLKLHEVADGALDTILPPPQDTPDTGDVERLCSHLVNTEQERTPRS